LSKTRNPQIIGTLLLLVMAGCFSYDINLSAGFLALEKAELKFNWKGWFSIFDSKKQTKDKPEQKKVDKITVFKEPVSYRTGQKVEVEWHKRWYSATIDGIDRKGRLHIHYDGYSAASDEWIDPNRVRLPELSHTPYKPGVCSSFAIKCR